MVNIFSSSGLLCVSLLAEIQKSLYHGIVPICSSMHLSIHGSVCLLFLIYMTRCLRAVIVKCDGCAYDVAVDDKVSTFLARLYEVQGELL